MKPLICLGLALAASPLFAEPALHVDSRLLEPGTTIKVTFDQPVAPSADLNRSLPNTVLTIEPSLGGTIRWLSPTELKFERTGVPRIGTEHEFGIRENLKHLDGSPIPAGKLRSVATTGFHYQDIRWSGVRRLPTCLVRFNDAVDPEALGSFFTFCDRNHRHVAATVRRAVRADLASAHLLGPTWDEFFRGWKSPDFESLDPETEIATTVVVTPVHPLPVGSSWRLRLMTGLPNSAKTGTIDRNRDRWIGTVRPFEVTSIRAVTQVDQPRRVSITFSKPLPEEITVEEIEEFLEISPIPKEKKITAKGSSITIGGRFPVSTKWKVRLRRGLAAADGMELEKSRSEELVFRHLSPSLRLPSHDESQLALGTRRYEIGTINIDKVRVRIKQVGGADAIRAFQGYRHYTRDGVGHARHKGHFPVPFGMVVGKTILDREFELENAIDTSKVLELDWNEILGGRDRPARLFVSVSGTPKAEVPGSARQPRLTQAFVQLTDIGLAWKLNQEEAFLYAYSCESGKPLEGVELTLFGEEAEAAHSARTDRMGVARLPRADSHRHLRASRGADAVIVPYDTSMPTVSMWRFPVRSSSVPELPSQRTALLFTDRALYRPGETVHLKGLVRRIENNRPVFDSAPGGNLEVRDSADRVLLEQDLELSKHGSFDLSFDLPPETVGSFKAVLSWPDELAGADRIRNWRMQAAVMNTARFEHHFNVQEFRRNAFEVEAEFVDPPSEDTLRLELAASYYQGQAVENGAVEWYFRSARNGFYPAEYRDYLFCDHRGYDPYYWSHYFGYGTGSSDGADHVSTNGTAVLDREGRATLEFEVPESTFPSPRSVTVTSEITDARNQNLSKTASTTVHSSSCYLGISRIDTLVRIGNEVPYKVVALRPDGTPVDEMVAATLTVTREVHEQIKTRTASGTIGVRNEVRIEPVEERPLTIEPSLNREGGLPVPFRPRHPGKHIVVLSGTDSAGKPFRTATSLYVYGSNDYPWAYESGMKIKLVPEKKAYQPGDTARILVLSPIEGTALVTLERDNVQRHLVRELRTDEPVIEIPLSDDDAPNTFVSVLVIKGSADNKREHKEPILRLGFCELTVANRRDRLALDLRVPGDYHRPGEEVLVEGSVRDHRGRPVRDAEVTLYAEDEGTLAVAGYDNPDPMARFYAPRQLRTKSGTSLDNFISENPEERHRFNKGFFVGGGGEYDGIGSENGEPPRLRTDFDPCAVWMPSLVTDAEGRFEVRFETPDTLTRYRVIAVAHQSAARFGSATTDFLVKKPLMLEPAAPRFASEGDRLQPKVLVQNATSYRGTWEVTLELGSVTHFTSGESRRQSQTVSLDADGSGTVTFDLTFDNTGTSDWKWSARPLQLEDEDLTPVLRQELSDAVASRFEVSYPMPILRETRFVRFEEPSARQNLLDGLTEELLDGRGELELEFGRSILMEAGGAIDFLLHYPYGCVEQTTSSTIPWIAALNMRDSVPALRNRTLPEIRGAIQAGADRLLSMQTRGGGLAYWPGGSEPTDWASAYGGMALLLCKEAGANVPDSAIKGLGKYLADHLRGLGEETDWWALETACRGCYTLALAGDPQVPYHNKLIANAEKLSPNALSFLALAVKTAGGENGLEEARRLLELKGALPSSKGHFLHRHPSNAYRLLALVTIDPDSGQCLAAIDRLLQARSRKGHWGTTWNNAWTLHALGRYATSAEAHHEQPLITLTTDEGTRELRLDKKQPSATIRIPLHGGMEVAASAPSGVFARVKLASKPKLAPMRAVSTNGLQILRTYERVLPDGTSERLGTPRVGDLVRVSLQATFPRDGSRYIAIDDPIPSLFEVINTDFESQAGRLAKEKRDWRISHKELRDDRAVFFFDRVPRGGVYTVTYHARVTSSGEATAPPAKIEAMYEPEFFALSSTQRFQTPRP